MKFLLTNDDGIDAPGLQALWQAAKTLGDPTIVAPLTEHSGVSHRVTTSSPLRLTIHHEQAFAVHGTPGDCARLGLFSLVPDVDWVLSGINAGGNLGADVHHSGTVAAVREAVIHGRPGIAISHYRDKGKNCQWERATELLIPLLQNLLAKPLTPGTFWNINLPDLSDAATKPEIVICPLDPNPLPLDYVRDGDEFHYSGDYHNRPRDPGTDVDVCFNGNIAVTHIRLF